MQAISLGHAGILIRTRGITIVCDPWFVPAFFGSWFVFPRNDQLPPDIMHDVCNPDFLYISHLHGDHFDAAFLAEKMNKNTTVLLPDFPTREMEREFNKLGFRTFERTINATEPNSWRRPLRCATGRTCWPNHAAACGADDRAYH